MAKSRKKIELPDTARGVLARNLATIMELVPAFDSQPKIAAKSKIGQSTIGRMLRAETPPTLDNLEALAKAFNLAPWQLLVPDLDPARPPSLGGGDQTEHERELLDRYRTATSRWKIAIRYTAGLRHEAQQEEAASYLLSKIFATPVPDERLGPAWTRPDRRHAVHEPGADYDKGEKKKKTTG